jgi:cation/acetate symporter
VAASANFPCILLTLHWKRCSTAGTIAGLAVGIVAAVGLTLVSPNLTYPKAVKAAAHKVLEGEAAKRAAATEALQSDDPKQVAKAKKEIGALDKAVAKANADIAKWADSQTSFMGLEEPWFPLKNPGIISIPLGFLAVLFGSLLFRDRRAESLWNEVYVRQNIALVVSKSTAVH